MSFKEKKILVGGLGLSGQSLVRFYKKKGYKVDAFDYQVLAHPDCEQVFTKVSSINWGLYEKLVYSPGFKLDHPLLEKAKIEALPIEQEIEVGASSLKQTTIGITGTNGKTTVTTLIAHLLNYAEYPAKALGNIGKPLTDAVGDLEDEIVVLELSSFQLDALKTPFLDQALLLNIEPDHLDRYSSYKAYQDSKLSIQNLIKPSGTFHTTQSIQEQYSDQIIANKVHLFDSLCINDFCEHGNGLIESNVLAACAVCLELGVTVEQIKRGLAAFKGLTHRLEKIAHFKEVEFINDSKATNPASVIAAIGRLTGPIRLILGGQDKGLDFSPLVAYLTGKVCKVYLIGQMQSQLKDKLGPHVDYSLCDSLLEATQQAFFDAKPMDQVVLSPGCSSFDMFKNFEHRGKVFKEIVEQIKGENL